MNEDKNTLNQYFSDLSLSALFVFILFFAVSPKNQPDSRFQAIGIYVLDNHFVQHKFSTIALSKQNFPRPKSDSPTFFDLKFEKYFQPFSIQISGEDFLPQKSQQNPLGSYLNLLFFASVDFVPSNFRLVSHHSSHYYLHFGSCQSKGWQIFAFLNSLPIAV